MHFGRLTSNIHKLAFAAVPRKLHWTPLSTVATSKGVIYAKLLCLSGKEKSKEIQVVENDLTKENVDAVVNAANSWLKHGGGVAGAIVKHGGTKIQQESDEYISKNGPVQTGDVAVTGPGSLACKFIIHAVGPVWEGGEKNEAQLLRTAVWNSLSVCHTHQLNSVAMPAISSGIFGFPKDKCADILFATSLHFFQQHLESSLEVIRFTNFDHATVSVFREAAVKFAREPNVRRESLI